MTVIGPVVGDFDPTHSAIKYTDHSGVNVTSERARFDRPITHDANRYAAPGSRVRFRTNAPQVTIALGYNGLLIDSYNDDFSILVNGVATDYAHGGHPTDFFKVLDFGTADYRNIEIIFPFGSGLDFKGVSQDPAYDFRSCLDRPATKLLAIGDSMTQGALGSKIRLNYTYLVAKALKLELVNLGISGGRLEHFGSAGWAAAIDPDIITVLLGYNDYGAQDSESTFKSEYTTLLNGLLTETTAPILVITPLWTNSALTIPISSYRTWIGQLVTAIGNARITVTDGLVLATNSTAHFPDGVHPNDAGNASITTNLTPIVEALL